MAGNLIWMENTRWRESGRQVKVGPLDGRLMLFIVIFFLKPSWFLFYTAILAICFFLILDYMGYSLPNALRAIRVVLGGKKKNGVHYWRQNTLNN